MHLRRRWICLCGRGSSRRCWNFLRSIGCWCWGRRVQLQPLYLLHGHLQLLLKNADIRRTLLAVHSYQQGPGKASTCSYTHMCFCSYTHTLWLARDKSPPRLVWVLGELACSWQMQVCLQHQQPTGLKDRHPHLKFHCINLEQLIYTVFLRRLIIFYSLYKYTGQITRVPVKQ